MEASIDSIREALICTANGSQWGYWKVPIYGKDKNKTTITFYLGIYRYTHMPFGLRNTPTTFQHAVNSTLSRVQKETSLGSIDGLVIFKEKSPAR